MRNRSSRYSLCFSQHFFSVMEHINQYGYQYFLRHSIASYPFLFIGVLLSSFIQVFLSEKVIQRWFPKNALLGMLFALVCGFCLPVCDCATIPMFKSLIKKGVPTSSAVVFMVATPVINPVVILSTYYAF